MTNARRIWLTRHGESIYNQKALIGGDSSLSPNGAAYAEVLPEVILSRLPKVRKRSLQEMQRAGSAACRNCSVQGVQLAGNAACRGCSLQEMQRAWSAACRNAACRQHRMQVA
jgi:hypothetical protein